MGMLLRIVAAVYLAAVALVCLANFESLVAGYPKPLVLVIGFLAAIPAALLYGFGQIISTVRNSHSELVLIRRLLAAAPAPRQQPVFRLPENAAPRVSHSRPSSPHAVAQFRRESEEAGLGGEIFEGIPWRQLPDGSINGLIADRLVRFRDWREFATAVQRH